MLSADAPEAQQQALHRTALCLDICCTSPCRAPGWLTGKELLLHALEAVHFGRGQERATPRVLGITPRYATSEPHSRLVGTALLPATSTDSVCCLAGRLASARPRGWASAQGGKTKAGLEHLLRNTWQQALHFARRPVPEKGVPELLADVLSDGGSDHAALVRECCKAPCCAVRRT